MSGLAAIALAGCDFGASGVGLFVRQVVPGLVTELRSRGLAVRVVGTREEHDAIGTLDETAHLLPSALNSPQASAVYALSAMPAWVRALGATVLYLPAANRRMPLLPSLPTVGTVHDLAQFHVTNKYGTAREVYVKHVLTPLLRRLTLALAVSQATADDLTRIASVAPERIRVVPNGVDDVAPSEAPNTHPRPYVLYASRLEHPGKNHLRVLEAYARSRLPASHDLIFTGKDWGALRFIEKLRADLHLTDRVHVLGFVSRGELLHWMTHADVVVIAGLFEGFGLPAAEALCLGRPVACSSTGSLPEVVGDLAALFDPTDVGSIRLALERAAGDTALRARCREEGPVWVRRFSWRDCIHATADALYEASPW